jgi:rare lipoprotein A
MRLSLTIAVAALIALSGCGGKKRAKLPAPARLGSSETGIASWYGHPYHGRRAANGEVYDMEKMTAAHRTLPFGTWLQVKNLSNGKTVTVRITDRGPFVGGRIVDLSHAAAVSIAMIGTGTAKVRCTVVAAPKRESAETAPQTPPQTPPPAPIAPQIAIAQSTGEFAAQVGVFNDRKNAERIQASMERRYGAARIVLREGQLSQWRVLVGHEATEEDAEALAARIRMDPEAQSRNAFVVRLDTE